MADAVWRTERGGKGLLRETSEIVEDKQRKSKIKSRSKAG